MPSTPADPPPPLIPDLLLDDDTFNEVVGAYTAADPVAAERLVEVEAMLSAVRTRVEPSTWAVVLRAVELLARRTDELVVAMVTQAITETAVSFATASPATSSKPGNVAPLTKSMLADSTLVNEAVAELLRVDPQHLRQSALLVRLGRQLRRRVDDRGWAVFLRVEDVWAARALADQRKVVAWAFEAGGRS